MPIDPCPPTRAQLPVRTPRAHLPEPSDMCAHRPFVRAGGRLLLSVPVGPDALVWNLHRRYGAVRLPLLLHGWQEVTLRNSSTQAKPQPSPSLTKRPDLAKRS